MKTKLFSILILWALFLLMLIFISTSFGTVDTTKQETKDKLVIGSSGVGMAITTLMSIYICKEK